MLTVPGSVLFEFTSTTLVDFLNELSSPLSYEINDFSANFQQFAFWPRPGTAAANRKPKLFDYSAESGGAGMVPSPWHDHTARHSAKFTIAAAQIPNGLLDKSEGSFAMCPKGRQQQQRRSVYIYISDVADTDIKSIICDCVCVPVYKSSGWGQSTHLTKRHTPNFDELL